MSLYSHAEPLAPSVLSMEAFMERHRHMSVIATESVSTFLGQIKDSMNSLISIVTLQSPDKVVADAISTKHQTLAKAREVSFANFRHVVISKPESFQGTYLEYLKDLSLTSAKTTVLVHSATDRLRLVLASFINEYTDNKAETLYGYQDFKSELKELEVLKKLMASYFPQSANKSKTTPDEVLKSFTDLPKIYDELRSVQDHLSEDLLKKIDRDSKNLAEMVDLLIDHNVKSGILNKNNQAKQELMECIHITAQLIEFYNALFSQLMFFCGSFKSLTEALNRF